MPAVPPSYLPEKKMICWVWSASTVDSIANKADDDPSRQSQHFECQSQQQIACVARSVDVIAETRKIQIRFLRRGHRYELGTRSQARNVLSRLLSNYAYIENYQAEGITGSLEVL